MGWSFYIGPGVRMSMFNTSESWFLCSVWSLLALGELVLGRVLEKAVGR